MFLVDKRTNKAECLYGVTSGATGAPDKPECKHAFSNLFMNVTFFAPFINIAKEKYEPESIENPEDITNKITLEAVIHSSF